MLRLRAVLERATSLAAARELWEATNNTDSMNYLIGVCRRRGGSRTVALLDSARVPRIDGAPPGQSLLVAASSTERDALAIEAIGGQFSATPPHATFSAFFGAADPTEANATCIVGGEGGGMCGVCARRSFNRSSRIPDHIPNSNPYLVPQHAVTPPLLMHRAHRVVPVTDGLL